MKVDTVLLDMDGVISDWVGSVFDLFDVQNREEILANWPDNSYETHLVLDTTYSEVWKRINKKEDFWTGMRPFPTNKELFSLLPENKTYICTKAGTSHTAASGKVRWLREHAKHLYNKFVITSHKYLCANPHTVLIDDHEDNCNLFIEAGGYAILYPQYYNENKHFVNNQIEYVKNRLISLGFEYEN